MTAAARSFEMKTVLKKNTKKTKQSATLTSCCPGGRVYAFCFNRSQRGRGRHGPLNGERRTPPGRPPGLQSEATGAPRAPNQQGFHAENDSSDHQTAICDLPLDIILGSSDSLLTAPRGPINSLGMLDASPMTRARPSPQKDDDTK